MLMGGRTAPRMHTRQVQSVLAAVDPVTYRVAFCHRGWCCRCLPFPQQMGPGLPEARIRYCLWSVASPQGNVLFGILCPALMWANLGSVPVLRLVVGLHPAASVVHV